jgi:hypothetical protein
MRTLQSLALATAFIGLATLAAGASDHHVNATLAPVDGSGISGHVELTAAPGGGTLIHVTANGLTPGTEYLSLYYSNHECTVEQYEPDDVIGRYTANAGGGASVTRKVGDDLDEIGSVSVRLASDFSLKSCADVRP